MAKRKTRKAAKPAAMFPSTLLIRHEGEEDEDGYFIADTLEAVSGMDDKSLVAIYQFVGTRTVKRTTELV